MKHRQGRTRPFSFAAAKWSLTEDSMSQEPRWARRSVGWCSDSCSDRCSMVWVWWLRLRVERHWRRARQVAPQQGTLKATVRLWAREWSGPVRARPECAGCWARPEDRRAQPRRSEQAREHPECGSAAEPHRSAAGQPESAVRSGPQREPTAPSALQAACGRLPAGLLEMALPRVRRLALRYWFDEPEL
jgi:hypothetical protein